MFLGALLLMAVYSTIDCTPHHYKAFLFDLFNIFCLEFHFLDINTEILLYSFGLPWPVYLYLVL